MCNDNTGENSGGKSTGRLVKELWGGHVDVLDAGTTDTLSGLPTCVLTHMVQSLNYLASVFCLILSSDCSCWSSGAGCELQRLVGSGVSHGVHHSGRLRGLRVLLLPWYNTGLKNEILVVAPSMLHAKKMYLNRYSIYLNIKYESNVGLWCSAVDRRTQNKMFIWQLLDVISCNSLVHCWR